jgi:ribosome biogenesis GTPase
VRAALDPDRIAAWRKLVREQVWIDDRKRAARERESSGRSYRTVQREARRRKGDL